MTPVWIDLTHPVHSDMPVWPDSEPPRISQQCEIDGNCPVRVSWLSLGAHTGTHIDAPAHFLAGGGMVEDIPLEDLIGPAWIADTADATIVDSALLERLAIPLDAQRILFRTSSTRHALMTKTVFQTDYVGLDLSGAEWLGSRNMKLVGFDYLSVQSFHASDETHRHLLRANTVLLEGLDLSRVRQGWYELVCLPFLAKGLEGSPARVVARPMSSRI